MDFGHQDVAAIDLFLGGFLNRFGDITVGDGAEQHIVFAGLLFDGETPDRVEGCLEVEGFLFQSGLTLDFLGSAVLHLLHHRWGEWNSLAEGQQEVAGITRGDFHQVSVLAEAEDVLIQNDLYALRHGTATDNDYGAIRNITTSAVPLRSMGLAGHLGYEPNAWIESSGL